MAIEFVDRVPTYANRMKITPESGAAYYATIERADSPIENGTALNAETFNQMQEQMEALIKLAQDAAATAQAAAEAAQAKADAAAPAAHAASASTYGVASASNYGHAKLSNSLETNSSTVNGTAATPYAVYKAYNKVAMSLSGTTLTITYTV